MAGIVLVAGSAAFLSSRQAEPVLDGADQGVMSLGGRVVPGRDTRLRRWPRARHPGRSGARGGVGQLGLMSRRNDLGALGRVPVAHLAVTVVALPVTAAAVGWLLAGREPATLARQPLE